MTFKITLTTTNPKMAADPRVQEWLEAAGRVMTNQFGKTLEDFITDVTHHGSAIAFLKPIPDQAAGPAFKGAVCRGSYALGSACQRCERCAHERETLGYGGGPLHGRA